MTAVIAEPIAQGASPYRAEIDGLRAVSVLAVILFHAGIAPFSGGFVGVDIFFTISGFLITGIIMKELSDPGGFSFLRFYERRVRRIVPALYCVMLACVTAAWFVMLPGEIEILLRSVVATSLFLSNIFFWKESGYFGPDADQLPLLHTWSLAVEEQFYLIFPVALMLVWRFGRSSTVTILAVIALCSLAYSQWASQHAPEANFYLGFSRAWELLAGALCAFLPKSNAPSRGVLAFIGLSLIAVSVFGFTSDTPVPSVCGLVPVAGTVLILLCADRRTRVGKLLSLPLLAGIGLISYSAYLWHQPLFAFARLWNGGPLSSSTVALLIAATLGIAYLSWRFVERPFRNPTRVPRRSLVISVVATSLLLLTLGAAGYLTDGFAKAWLSAQDGSRQRAHVLLAETRSARGTSFTAAAADSCLFDSDRLNAAVMRRIEQCATRHGPGILVLGDSHATNLFATLERSNRGRFPFLVGITQGGCLPYSAAPDCAYDRLTAMGPAVGQFFGDIIYEQAGFRLMADGSDYSGKRGMFSGKALDARIEGVNVEGRHLRTVATYLDRLARYSRVTWFGPRIEPHISPRQYLQHACDGPYRLRPGQWDIFTQLDRAIENGLRSTRVRYVSQLRAYDFRFPDDFGNCDALFWSDGDHFSDAGARRFSRRLDILDDLQRER